MTDQFDQLVVLRSVLANTPDRVVVLDVEGRPLVFNEAASNIFGLGPIDTQAE